MERIEKIENIIKDDSVTKTIMTINDGEKELTAEIYLAYIDNSTNKRYVVYTTDLDKTENEKGTFSLATLKFNQNEYLLEETTKEDHQDIELKALNIIGLSGDKSPEEVKKEFERELPDVTIIDLATLKSNVENMTISSNKPPKKANMPMAIANVIKKYYLFQLNLELKKIHNNVSMSSEQINNSNEKLNKIDKKLDELKDTYNEYDSKKAEKNLKQIESAKESILEAKRSLDAKMNEQGIDIIPELPETDEEYKSEVEEKEESNDKYDITESMKEETNKIKEEVEKIMEEEKNSLEQPKEEIQENTTLEQPKEEQKVESNLNIEEPVKEDVQSEIQPVINNSVNEFGLSVETIVNQLTNGISSIYEGKLQKKEEENTKLREQISSSENEKAELLTMVEDVKNKALQASEQAKNSKNEITDLKNKNITLETENTELKGTVDSQKQLLDQQNSNMEALREEGKTRETILLKEIELLKQENSRLKQYENAYNQIVGMVNSQKTTESSNNTK